MQSPRAEARVKKAWQAFARQGNDDVAVFPCDLAVEDLGGCARRICFGAGPEAVDGFGGERHQPAPAEHLDGGGNVGRTQEQNL